MSKSKRVILAAVGMLSLAAICIAAPTYIQIFGWAFLWFAGAVADAPGSYPILTVLEWSSYVLPILAYFLILRSVIAWVRKVPAT